GRARSSPTSTPATRPRSGWPRRPGWSPPTRRSTGSGSGAARAGARGPPRPEAEGAPGGVVVAAVAAVLGAAVDEGAGLVAGQAGAEPDLVEQLVAGRLAGLLEPVGPGARRPGRGVAGLARAGLCELGERG